MARKLRLSPRKNLIEYYEKLDAYKDKPGLIAKLKTLLLGDVDTEPKLVIGGKLGYAEFRWVKKSGSDSLSTGEYSRGGQTLAFLR